jgi:hypothetical protein
MEDVKTSTGGKSKKPKKIVEQVVAEPIVESVAVEPEQEIIPEQWVKPESDYTPTDWAALNDPPEPGVTDVAATPTGVNVVRRGFTTLQMAIAFRNSLRDPADYLIVEVRESAGFALEGPILCHYVAHKTEEL